MTKPNLFFLFIVLCWSTMVFGQNNHLKNQQPKISFTFDDGSTEDMPNYPLKVWNELLLSSLEKHHLKAILFAKGKSLQGEKGVYILSSWNKAQHKIGNHTYSHDYYNSKKITLEAYKADFLINDSIVKAYSNFYPYFRFPYLKEGDTKEKVEGFRQFLKEQDYQNGHVTIDASDWYINGRLITRLKENASADISGFKQYYIEHLYNRALYYDSLATDLTGRKISHNILLHHNLTSALFLDELIQHFKSNGWEVMDADEAYKDEIYKSLPTYIPAGESLIWALSKEAGNSTLRYPAEDGRYEKQKMDLLGL